MASKLMRSWKKVYESDLSYVVSELKETLERPATLFLTGDLGSGKTTFTRIFIGGQEVQSPTYSLIMETPTTIHADFYRLEKVEDLLQMELNLYLEGKDFLIIEWGKKYLSPIDKEVDERFRFYELTIEMNAHTHKSSRNYSLYSLDRS